MTANGRAKTRSRRRLALASDLRWLINEGYLIEFNDGSLDRPRMKSKQTQSAEALAAASATTVETTASTDTLAATAYLARILAVLVGRLQQTSDYSDGAGFL